MDEKNLDYYYDLTKEFHVSFNHPHGEKPQLMNATQAQFRAEFMKEEVVEFLEAQTIESQADAMIDLIYFALGTMVELGVKPAKLFEIVHEANMSKLGKDGKPIYDPRTNKVKKPAHWIDPEPRIQAEIRRQQDIEG